MGTNENFRRESRKIQQYANEMAREFGVRLRQIGEEMMTDAKASSPGRGVPRDTGALAASGRVEGPASGRVTLSFGDASTAYALVQHERMDYRHTVGEPRYLVRAVDRWTEGGSAAMDGLRAHADAIAARIGTR